MNFLAHLYLSGENREVIIGNFIGDAVKGNKYLLFPKDIQRGILCHRAIDSFTDTHPIVKKSKGRLRSRYGLYSGIIVDIIYDHFLARHWYDYSVIPLEVYADAIYKLVASYKKILPEKVLQMLPYMIEGDWLTAYASVSGIANVLKGMSRRVPGGAKMQYAIQDLKRDYDVFNGEFRAFFQEAILFSEKQLL